MAEKSSLFPSFTLLASSRQPLWFLKVPHTGLVPLYTLLDRLVRQLAVSETAL